MVYIVNYLTRIHRADHTMAVVPFRVAAEEVFQSLESGSIRINDKRGIDTRVLVFIDATSPTRPGEKEDTISVTIPKGVVDK